MCMPDVEAETERSVTYRLILRILIVVQLVIGVLDITSDSAFYSHGIFGVFLAFVLYMTQKVLNHHLILIQILLSLYFTTQFLWAVLTYFQNGLHLISENVFPFTVFVISFIYYLSISIFAYFPYKEFKTMTYKRNPALAHIFRSNVESDNLKQVPKSKEVTYNPAYGAIPIDPRKRNNDHGIFQVSRGKGIKL